MPPCLLRIVSVLCALVLASCTTDEAEVFEDITTSASLPSGAVPSGASEAGSEAGTSTELCDAATYRPLIGTNVSEAVLPEIAGLRVFSINDIVTRDFIPQRTNVVYETGGEISQVYCG